MADDPNLDPDMAAAFRRIAEIAAGLGPLPEAQTAADMRNRLEAERRWWNEDLPAMDAVVEVAVPGPQGSVPARVLFPTAERPAAAIVYVHGGGWVAGSLETHHRAMRCLALAAGSAVVGVDYRLAPEHLFPAGLNDCIAVVSHLADRGGELGLDPGRIAIAGDSAGANIALATALALLRTGDSPVRSLALIYGAFAVTTDTDSYRAFADGRYGLSLANMRWYLEQYASSADDYTNPLFAPALARLSGLPPTHLFAAELDVLRDDSVALADRLRGAGVPTTLRVYDGVVHAFINYTRMVAKARMVLRDAGQALRRDLTG